METTLGQIEPNIEKLENFEILEILIWIGGNFRGYLL